MKTMHVGLLCTSLVVAAGLVSAFVFTRESVAGASDPMSPSIASAAGSSEPRSQAATQTDSTWQRDVTKQLSDIRSELAAMRHLLEAQGAGRSDASVHSSSPSGESDWNDRLHDAELRLLADTIARHRENVRIMLEQESETVADKDASSETRQLAEASIQRLDTALKDIDRVRTRDALSAWCRQYSIDPLR